jgi:hypothetical protein
MMAKRNPDEEEMKDEENQAEIDAESTRKLREDKAKRVEEGTDKGGKHGPR